jgi:Pyruvate:ferredoxin oxidoreductase and related 2-oxoacid:ferredoxin oxidoreductases, gamma subunit
MTMAGNKKFDCIIVGLGGQGSIFASGVLGETALREGFEVISAETHGMAQRGGTVEVHVRIGSSFGPLIPLRSADAIVGMEPAECLRFARYLSPEGTAILNTHVVPAAGSDYPPVANLIKALSASCGRVIAYDATRLALEAGHPQTLNVVMLGTLARLLPFSTLEDVLVEYVPKKALEANVRAFKLGQKYSKRNLSSSARHL